MPTSDHIDDRFANEPSSEELNELRRLRIAQERANQLAERQARKSEFSLGRVFALFILACIILVALAGFM